MLRRPAAPAVKAPAAPKLVPAAAPAPAEKPDVPAANVAFVEPKFAVKGETKQPVEPTVRAQEAAVRFADKTAAELVAVTSHADMKQDAASGSAPAIQPAVNLAAEQKAQMAQALSAAGRA